MKTQAQLDALARWRERNRENEKLRALAWRIANPDKARKGVRAWAEANPEKTAASQAVKNAVYEGKLKKQLCLICGADKTEGHHASYDKDAWFDVVWLCRKHHREVHAKGVQAREAKLNEQRWTAEMLAEAAALRNTGAQWKVVGAKFGVSETRIREIITIHGIEVKPFSRWGPRKPKPLPGN